MRGQARRGCCLAIVAALASSGSAFQSADLFDEIYARGRPLEASIKTLTGRFIEESTSALLSKPVVARGTMAVIRPSQIALHYQDPERRTVLIDATTLRVIWPSRSLDQQMPIGATQKRIQRYFVDQSPKQLRSQFAIVATEASDRKGAWLVTMVPKRQQIREGLSKLELWIEQDTVMLSALRMTFANGDTKRMQFDEVRLNPAIDAALFKPNGSLD